jgi:hypothetical protein
MARSKCDKAHLQRPIKPKPEHPYQYFRRISRQFDIYTGPIKSGLKGIVHPSPFSDRQVAKYQLIIHFFRPRIKEKMPVSDMYCSVRKEIKSQ